MVRQSGEYFREPIRIARIITRLNVGGPARHAVNLSAGLDAFGYRTLLLHGRVGEREGDMTYLIPPEPPFDVVHVRSLGREIAPASDAVALAALVRLLRRFRPHIVHTHMAKAGGLGRAAAIVYNATARMPARILHTYHGHVLDGYFSAPAARVFSAVERALARRSDALLAVSPAVRRDLIDAHAIGSDATLRVVPLGLELTRFAATGTEERRAARAAVGLADEAHVVAFVGRLTAIKQPERFFEAAALIARADPAAHFIVAGGGDREPAAREQAAALGLGDRIRFLGWQRDVAPVYAAADVVALTSRNEGTPVALIESMASAVPAAAFDVGGVADVIASPDVGVLVSHGDVEGLARAIVALLRDAPRRIAIGARARAHVVERYGVDRLLRDIDALYRQLL